MVNANPVIYLLTSKITGKKRPLSKPRGSNHCTIPPIWLVFRLTTNHLVGRYLKDLHVCFDIYTLYLVDIGGPQLADIFYGFHFDVSCAGLYCLFGTQSSSTGNKLAIFLQCSSKYFVANIIFLQAFSFWNSSFLAYLEYGGSKI